MSDYTRFFKEYHNGVLPLSIEEVSYLFRRHDRVQSGKVMELDFIEELIAL